MREESSTKPKGGKFLAERSDNMSKRPKKKSNKKKPKKDRFKEGSLAGFLGKFYTKGKEKG